jgi:Ca2+-binding RTX toxin-like protein
MDNNTVKKPYKMINLFSKLPYGSFNNKGSSILVTSSFFISLIVLFSVNYISTSDAAFCKAVKYKDDGDNDFNIYIGTSRVGIDECIIGTNHKDVIIGGDGDDYINGKKADDNLQGRFNNDRIIGDEGDDSIQGGPGGDYLYGKDDNDVIFAGFDSDFLSGADGNDELYGDFGEDILEGGRGADYFDCGENYDIVLDYDPGDGDILANNCEEVNRT